MPVHSLPGQTAFPCPDDVRGEHSGLTVREWFAGMALIGILANPDNARAQPPLTHAERADAAFKAADAMLAESAKE